MTSVQDRLAALDAMDTPEIARASGRLRFAPVEYSREIERVKSLPMRDLPDFSGAERNALRRAVTKPHAEMSLWDTQCAALLAALEARREVHPERRAPGFFGAISVGGGKTLVASLLGTIWQVDRVVVLTTASLRHQTESMVRGYRRDFRLPRRIDVVPYSKLSHADHGDVLDRLRPQAIVADEGHALRNKSSARGRRIRRYLKKRPDTLLAILTGTIARSSLMDWAELADLALGDWAPIPRDYPTRKAWAQALDDDPVRGIGALNLLVGRPCSAVEVREHLSQRVARGPGCAASHEGAPDVPLTIRVLQQPHSALIQKACRDLLNSWARPDGEELSLAPEFAEVDRQLRLGGYYGWAYEPDREWLRIRRAYKRALRAWIETHPGADYDSMLAVERQILAGSIQIPEYGEWAEIRERAKEPPKVWRWVDEAIAEFWASRSTKEPPAVCFGQRRAFAQRVAELSKVPYFAGGDRQASEALRREKGDRPIVASLQAYKTGQNLQAFRRACVFDVPPGGSDWEQLLGRLHRPGQTAKEVTYEITHSFLPELQRAQDNSDWLSQTDGRTYRLQVAEIELE